MVSNATYVQLQSSKRTPLSKQTSLICVLCFSESLSCLKTISNTEEQENLILKMYNFPSISLILLTDYKSSNQCKLIRHRFFNFAAFDDGQKHKIILGKQK